MKKGAILIVTTWILMILTLFAVGVGFRTGLEIKLTGYNLDRIKALYIAKSGIKKAVIEKWKEYIGGKSIGLDAFSEPWANNEKYFKNIKTSDGIFTLSYKAHELDRSDREIILYGLQDETARIDINSEKALPILQNLLLNTGLELKRVKEIMRAIKEWDHIQNSGFSAPEELLLSKEIPEEILYGGDINKDGVINEAEKTGILGFITVYGDGAININTAPKEVLDALFGPGFPGLALKISDYRNGIDGRIGTDDDRWFLIGESVIERSEKGMVEVKNLNDENWYGNIFDIKDHEYKKLKELASGSGLLKTSSDYYRAHIKANVDKVKKVVEAVIKFNTPQAVREYGFSDALPPPNIEYLFWHEES